MSDQLGQLASITTEYADYGIGLSPANNDRAAGYLRLCELLHVDPRRIPPAWASMPAGLGGAPRLYLFTSKTNAPKRCASGTSANEKSKRRASLRNTKTACTG